MKQCVECYDVFRAASRLRPKTAASASGTTTNRYVYDGWNILSEVSSQNSEVSTNYYTWGLDLSGSLQGACGIGGLLSVIQTGGTGATPSAHFPDSRSTP